MEIYDIVKLFQLEHQLFCMGVCNEFLASIYVGFQVVVVQMDDFRMLSHADRTLLWILH